MKAFFKKFVCTSLVNNYLDCVENLIISYNCSVAAARWQRELDRRGLQPLLTDTGCVLDNSTGKTIYVYHSTSADHQTQGNMEDLTHIGGYKTHAEMTEILEVNNLSLYYHCCPYF